MNPDDTRETMGDVDETPAAPPEGTQGPLERLGAVIGSGLNRRKFLAAAALGNKADGLGGLQFGPLSAFAHDISTFQCTANDFRVRGPGRIINEPCGCSGTFTAQVEF